MFVVGFCLPVTGRWLLVAGYWSLVTGRWLLVAGCWLLVAGCWLLVTGEGVIFSKRRSLETDLSLYRIDTKPVCLGYKDLSCYYERF
jgi:hypothetical protein